MDTIAQSKPSFRLDALTGVRALAALWVVFFHMNMGDRYHFDRMNPIVGRGYLGVDLFFILSGFILALVHLQDFKQFRPRAYCQFLMLRLARLMPVHLVIMGLFGLFYLALLLVRGYHPDDAQHFTPIHFIYSLLNIHAWGVADHLSWNYLSWSISAEWFAYLFFPFLAFCLCRLRSRLWSSVGAILAFTGLFLFFQACQLTTVQEALTFPLVRVSFEFIAGIHLFCLYQTFRSDDVSIRWDILTIVAFAGTIGLMYGHASDFVLIPALGLCLLLLAKATGWVCVFLSSRPMVHIGEISYSMYLSGAFITTVLEQFIKMGHLTLWLSIHEPHIYMAIYLIALFCMAEILYFTVEIPARKMLRKRIKALFSPQTQSTAVALFSEKKTLNLLPSLTLQSTLRLSFEKSTQPASRCFQSFNG